MAGERGAASAAANAAQYAAAAQAYSDAAHGAAQGIDELKASVAELDAQATAAAGALAKIVAAVPSTSPAGSPRGGGGGGPGRPSKDPAIADAEKRAKAEAKAAEYVYQIKQRYLRQEAKDDAKAANDRRKGAYADKPAALGGIDEGLRKFKAEQDKAKGKKAGGGVFGGDASEVGQPGVDKNIRYLLKQAGISKAAMRAPLTAGLVDASKLALGYKGMAQLSQLGARAEFNLRRLFAGVDASPAVRGVDRFLQVLNPASATGKALEGIFRRTFSSIFGDVEKLAPLAQTAFQGMVLGALYVEEAWLDARIALYPLTSAIEGMIGPTDAMTAAAYAGEAALAAFAYAAAGAAAPFIAAAAAITVAYTQYKKLKAEMAAGGAQAVDNRHKAAALGEGSDAAAGVYGAKRTSDADFAAMVAEEQAAKAKPAGAATGKALADGMAQGMAQGIPAVAAGGQALGAAAAAGARVGADAHSPSRKTERTGEDMGDGAILGMRAKRGDVQAEGETSLVPTLDGKARGGGQGARGDSSGSGSLVINMYWPEGVDKARRGEMQAAAEAGVYAALRAVNGTLAIPRGIT